MSNTTGTYGSAVTANVGIFKSRIDSTKMVLLQKLTMFVVSVLLVVSLVLMAVFVSSSTKNSRIDIILFGLFAPVNFMILAMAVYLHVKGELLTDKLTHIWAFAILFIIQSIFIDIVLSLMK